MSWIGRKWRDFFRDPLLLWSPDVYVTGDIVGDVPLPADAPKLTYRIFILNNSIVLSIMGDEVAGSRTVEIGAQMRTHNAVDALVNALLDARRKAWP